MSGRVPDSAGEDQHVGTGHLGEGRVGDQTQHPVVAAHLSGPVADEGHVDARHPLEHLVGPDGVEGGEPRKERDRDLERVVCHRQIIAGLLVVEHSPSQFVRARWFGP